MDTKELKSLMEAYHQVYAPQEVEQLDEITASMGRRAKKYREDKEQAAHMERMRQHQERMKNDPEYKKSHEDSLKTHAREEVDVFDTVLEFLQAEGYAETLEEAEWMMANVIDEEAIDIILGEGHGSRTSFKKQSEDERKRVSMFKGSKIEYTPHKNYDPEANRGQGQILRPNQAEKQRRKKLAKSAMGEDYVNEAQAARENPEKYEREQSKKYAPVRGERTPMPPRGDKRREDFEKWYAANVR